MLPVTFAHTVIGTGAKEYYLDSRGARQKPPYNLVTGLERQEGFAAGIPDLTRASGELSALAFNLAVAGNSRVDNQAYSRFIGKLHAEDADAGITLGEHRAARDALNKRCKQLYTFALAIKRRDFGGAISSLKVDSPRNKPVRLHREFAANYLEWSWGWRPMIEDIYNILEVLSHPIKPRTIRAAATSDPYPVLLQNQFSDVTEGQMRTYLRLVEPMTVNYKSSTGASFIVDNPNVVLANRLGLINPAGIFWAVQPFSFVVDKYINIGQMINSLTDLYGFTLSQEWKCRTTAIFLSGSRVYIQTWYGSVLNSGTRTWSGSGKAKVRQLGLLKPTLSRRDISIGSFGEAVSYFALLIQLLSGR